MQLRKFRVTLNGKEYIVEMEEIGASGSAGLAPSVAVPSAPAASAPMQPAPVVEAAKPAPAPQPAASAPVGEGIVVEAPMPGNILDVKVKVGDSVSVNQVLLVLEAMKMENDIVAPVAGVVSEVHVINGSSIDVGKAMIVIQEGQ